MATVQTLRSHDVSGDEIVWAPNGVTGSETRVVHVRVVHDFVIETIFADGFTRRFDMGPDLAGTTGRFAELCDAAYFAMGAFDPDLGTIAWPNGFDLAPEFLRWGPDPDAGG